MNKIEIIETEPLYFKITKMIINTETLYELENILPLLKELNEEEKERIKSLYIDKKNLLTFIEM